MPLQQKSPAAVRSLESTEEFVETRLEAVGFIFHGTVTEANGKPHSVRSPSNLLHFARCPKLEKVGDNETKIWFRSVRVALKHLDELIGHHRWKWCKVCEREITQRILDQT
ncbi:MAG: hypothetical protein ACHRXM_21240 [Isosphaerales bacterium]